MSKNIKILEYEIIDILVIPSSWDSQEIELVLITGKLIIKNNYIPYQPETHSQLFEEINLSVKMQILWEEVFSILEMVKTISDSQEPFFGEFYNYGAHSRNI